ncbi:MAG: hypothetical protein J7L47_08800 [Candidatus Odinarchaeota archaeon]|nr:hypothetical protein [Candidatus Odinarchaeota archaeon]
MQIELLKLLSDFYNSQWGNKLITMAIFFIIFYVVLALVKQGTKTAAEKIVQNKPKAALYTIGIAGIMMIIFASKIAAYLEVNYWLVVEIGIIVVLIGFIELIFKGGKKVVHGIKEI